MKKLTIAEMHSIIRQTFKISIRRAKKDNMPIGSKRERETLGSLFCELGLNKGAEIGVKQGAFSKILCEANPNIELSCIDSWESPSGKDRTKTHERNYNRAVATLSKFNTTVIRKKSLNALSDFEDESLDFVYIDANHSFDFACPDIIFWSQKVRSGGIVACHDYFSHYRGGVVKAVDAYTHCHSIRPWYVTVEKFPTAFWVKP